MAASSLAYFQSCFNDWIAQQQQDLDELLGELSTDSEIDDEKLKLLIEKSITHLEEYSDRRALMVQHDAPSFVSPSWCSYFENAFLWLGGWRPSLFVRLVYTVCGSKPDAQFPLTERNSISAEISAEQLHMIDTMNCKTIIKEDNISARTATLQEEVTNLPNDTARVPGESSEELDRAMDAHCCLLASIVVDADRLRLSTLKESMGILTPRQGVDLLVATKRLDISMHEWGKKMNHQLGKKDTMATK